MRVAVTIQHPSHVHFYRRVVDDLREAGHEVRVYARENEVTRRLLEAYDVPHAVLAGDTRSTLGRAAVTVAYELRVLRALRAFDPDVVTGVAGVAAAHVAPLVGARSVVFLDREGLASTRLVTPFAHAVCTPAWFDDDFGRGHRRYEGCQQLAYLHPDRFTPDARALSSLGVDPYEPYAVLRFVDGGPSGGGSRGFSSAATGELISLLEDRGDVYVSTEGPLPEAFEPYRLPVPAHRIHDLLAHADVYVGDSRTMAAEAGLLATPAVRVDPFAGATDGTTFRELAARGLVHSFADEDRALGRVRDLVADPDAGATWRARRDDFLAETVDVTDYVVSVLGEEARNAPDGPRAVVG